MLPSCNVQKDSRHGGFDSNLSGDYGNLSGKYPVGFEAVPGFPLGVQLLRKSVLEATEAQSTALTCVGIFSKSIGVPSSPGSNFAMLQKEAFVFAILEAFFSSREYARRSRISQNFCQICDPGALESSDQCEHALQTVRASQMPSQQDEECLPAIAVIGRHSQILAVSRPGQVCDDLQMEAPQDYHWSRTLQPKVTSV